MTGRRSDYAPEVALAICRRLAEGESLRAICAGDDMPAQSTVFRWLGQYADFREQYARAREAQADVYAHEILDIADTPQEGVRVKESEDGIEITREDMLGHRRLQVDARKWLMSKLAPKKYGDKLQHSGDPENPVRLITEIRRTIVDSRNPDSAGVPAAADPGEV